MNVCSLTDIPGIDEGGREPPLLDVEEEEEVYSKLSALAMAGVAEAEEGDFEGDSLLPPPDDSGVGKALESVGGEYISPVLLA